MAGSQLHGRRLGGVVLDAPLARGAMGEVWSATHAETGLRAAVKIVGGATPALAEALRREIRSAAALSDPRIVQLYDAGDVADDLPGLPAGALRDAARVAEADASFAGAMALTGDPVRRADLATLRAGSAIVAGHAAEAIGRLDLLASAFDGPDLAFPRATFLDHRAFAHTTLGAWADAERDLREAVAMRYGMGSRAGSWVTLWAGLLVLVGRVDDAEKVLDTHDVGGDTSEALPRAAIAAARGAWDEGAHRLAPAYGVFRPRWSRRSARSSTRRSDAGGSLKTRGAGSVDLDDRPDVALRVRRPRPRRTGVGCSGATRRVRSAAMRRFGDESLADCRWVARPSVGATPCGG